MYRIRLARLNREFSAAPDVVILDAAEDAGIGLPHSCRSGTCRACLTRVISGCVEHDPEFIQYLSIDRDEIESGYRLLCSAFARSDVELDR